MKLILKNLLSLALVQGISLLAPLIIAPFLIPNIGLEQYGVVALSTAIASFFMIFTDFGMNITAIRRLVDNKNEPHQLRMVLHNIFHLKFALTIIAFIFYVVLIGAVPIFRHYFLLHLCSFSLVVASTFMPSWYFQAFENTNKIILTSLLLKVLSICLVLLLVTQPADAMYINLILGGGNMTVSAILCFYIYRKHSLPIYFSGGLFLHLEFKNGVPILLANLGTAVFSNFSIIILSFFLSPVLLGAYSIAEKIIQILKGFLALLHHTTYSRICQLINHPKLLAKLIRQFYIPVWISAFLLGVCLYLQPQLFVSYFIKQGESRAATEQILQKMSFLIFIISLNMPFFQTLLAHHKDWLLVKVILGASFLSLSLNILLQFFIGLNGTLLSMYTAEIIVATSYIIYSQKFLAVNKYASPKNAVF
jgi:polysaccharide transporter, PST family